jgi:hypothetical protein
MSSLASLFWKCVAEDTDNCIFWPRPSKYGRARGPIFEGGKSVSLSRAACVLAHGAPQEHAQHAAHRCGNPSCINPRHLSWKTPAENNRDQVHHAGFLGVKLRLDWVRPEYIERVTGALQVGISPQAVAHSFGMPVSVVLEIHSTAMRRAGAIKIASLLRPDNAEKQAVTLAEFFDLMPPGELSRMAQQLGHNKSSISNIANQVSSASGRLALKIQRYAASAGYLIDPDSLVSASRKSKTEAIND